MEAARAGSDPQGSRFEGLRAEASAAVGYSANTLRAVRERYREAYAEALGRWHELRDELDANDRGLRPPRTAAGGGSADGDAAAVAEAEAADARIRDMRTEVELLGADLGAHQSTLAKLDVAGATLERMWLFMEQRDVSLIGDDSDGLSENAVTMRVLEAQEAERARIAQDVHDGPAQALTNAIFQAELIERLQGSDPAAAAGEIRVLRDLLRRELADVRDSINQLRPPMLDELGLDGAIEEAAGRLRVLSSLDVTTELTGSTATLDDRARTVVLRVAQEALQNVRKHADATTVVVRTETTGDDAPSYILEVRDDGRGFDVGAVAARGRRNFGLQFMRERAALIGGRFDVRSRPDGGTVVRLEIPTPDRTGAEESR